MAKENNEVNIDQELDQYYKGLDESLEELSKGLEKLDKEEQEHADKLQDDVIAFLEENYGTDDINNILSVKAKIERIKAQTYYIENGKLDKDAPEYANMIVEKMSPDGKAKVDKVRIDDIISQLEESVYMEDLKNKVKKPFGNINEGKVRTLNNKINSKLKQQEDLFGSSGLYVNIVHDIYHTLNRLIEKSPSSKYKCLMVTIAIGKYMNDNAKLKPYLVREISTNIVNIGSFGDKLDQNTIIIENLNDILKKLNVTKNK